ncbi:MAG: DinB family protein, partial [Acidobacteria bacterium]|nr:DinB family protein [Acidobacteriota bacterium]
MNLAIRLRPNTLACKATELRVPCGPRRPVLFSGLPRTTFSSPARITGNILILLFVIGCGAAAQSISDQDRAYLTSHLEMTREFVRDTTANLTRAQWQFQTEPRRWSIAQCVDHLARTEEAVLQLLRQNVLHSKEPLLGAFPSMAKGRKSAGPPKRMTYREDSYILRWMTDRGPAVSVPVERRPPIEEVAPRGIIADPTTAIDHFERVRAQTLEFVKSTQEDLRGHFVQAPMVG